MEHVTIFFFLTPKGAFPRFYSSPRPIPGVHGAISFDILFFFKAFSSFLLKFIIDFV
jgi:hypothetical protein